MIYHIYKWILRLYGWKVATPPPPDLKKYVMIIAPHTSLWDFVWGRMILTVLHLKVKFLIKQEAFWFPLGLLLKAMGGLPVNRKKGGQMIHQVVEAFSRYEELVVVITPEATRAPIKNWKKGYYFIAQKAGLPIGVGFLDYRTRTYGLGFIFYPTGDYEKDFRQIASFYSKIQGKFPERFALPDTE